jgi:S1-C subfamily serine protease
MKLKDWLRPYTFTQKVRPNSWSSHGIWLLHFALALTFLCNCYAMSTEELFKAARSAVVEIVTQDKSGSPLLTGTGFFISNDGKLVTNRHVVEGAATIVAKTEQGSFFVCKGVLAEPKDADIAILKFEANNVPYLTLATDPHLSPGQKIVVIGNPLGLEGSVSEGIISAMRTDQGLVQITAPISPGSSGSPVMTEDAKVMGVATLQSERGQNLNFAIPVQFVNAALAGIEQKNPASPLAGATSSNQASEVVQARGFLDSHDDVPAARVLKDYLARNPTDPEGWVTYAEALGGMQRWEAAADAAQKAVDLDPKSLDRWRALTYCVAMFNGQTNDSNPVASARLKEVAQHDLAMGDDFNMAYYALIQAAEAQGEKEKAAQLRQQYEKLIESGELADYEFGKERRYFGKQTMYPAEQVAKLKGLELTEKAQFLDLKGRGHFFTLPIDPIDGIGTLVDGIELGVSSRPVRYKHQRYYLDSELVEVVIDGVLNPKMGPPSPEFSIQNIYLEEHLPIQGSDLRHTVTQKLIDAALKLDPSLFFLFNYDSFIAADGVVINLKCEQSDDLAEGCQIATKLGNEFSNEWTPGETADVMERFAEWERAKLANAFQILFARRIVANFSKAKVTASTAVESLPHPTKNPSLVVHIVLPNRNYDESYEMIARSLSQSAATLNSELSK